ncbi:MAG: oligopeptide:H+ symporter [Bacteroidota bacterium]
MEKTFFGHPRGLATLFFTEMWERFSFYGMRAILILFMVGETAKEGLGLDTETAGAAYGLYTAAVYLLALPGGRIADTLIGQRKAIFYGGILIMIGHGILAIPAGPGVFFAGLAFVALGTGFLKPNISSLVGTLYGDDKGARRDAGFSIFYMSINLGSFIGQILVPVAASYNWHLGFGLAAIGMFFGLVYFKMTEDQNFGSLGLAPEKSASSIIESDQKKDLLKYIIPSVLVLILVTLQMTGQIDIGSIVGVAEAMKYVIVLVAVFYFAYVLFAGGLDGEEFKKVLVIILLFIGGATFWSGFEQAGSALNIFAQDWTNRNILGTVLPAGTLQSANSGFIIIFAPIMGALWVWLAKRNLNPRTPIKFAIGLVLLGLGFLVMVSAAQIAAAGAKAGMFFLILTYFFHSIGELCLSPVGLSSMTKLSPTRYVGQMMGLWFVATALGNLIAGTFAGNFDPSNVGQMPDLFWVFVKLPVGVALIFVAVSPIVNKWMKEVH